jgi:tetratricopeptide (TPR) repeat protein
MKGERRHELKHNELLDWINRVIEKVKPYSKAILGSACIGALALALTTWWMRYSKAQAAGAWDGVYAGLDSGQPAELEKLAEMYSGSDVSHWATLAAGDLYLSIGCSELFANKASAETELEKAIDNYRKVQEESRLPELREQATFGLGRAYEAKAGCNTSLKRWRDQVEKSERERDEAEEAYKAAVEAPETGDGAAEQEDLKKKLDEANSRLKEASEDLDEFKKRVEEDVKNRLEMAKQQYLALKESWPNGVYAELAAGRLADLGRDGTRDFYYEFTQFDPQPAFSEAGSGETSGLDPDTFLDDEEVTGFPQLEGFRPMAPGETIEVEGTEAAGEPEAGEPEPVEPEAGEPEPVEPEAGEPEPVEPEAGEPEPVEPDAAEPKAAEPEASGREPPGSDAESSEPMPDAKTSASEKEEPASEAETPSPGSASTGEGEPKPPEPPKSDSAEAVSESSE